MDGATSVDNVALEADLKERTPTVAAPRFLSSLALRIPSNGTIPAFRISSKTISFSIQVDSAASHKRTPSTITNLGLSSPWRPAIAQLRPFNSTSHLREAPKDTDRQDLIEKEKARREEEEEDNIDEHGGFERSEKASKAAQVNLSARLSSGKSQKNSAGFGEIWRLIKIARPEAKWLALAFAFLLVSSSITMSIPFSIGKILDLATKDPAEGNTLFGLDINQFYLALGVVLTFGAAANYGRIIILRIVGERIVARLRSQLYRRTYVQNAEFFDANRVGDLISRLSSDTVIVGKSITQNLSDGLRAMVSGGAGFAAMAWVSLKAHEHSVLDVPTYSHRCILLRKGDSKSESKNSAQPWNIDKDRRRETRKCTDKPSICW